MSGKGNPKARCIVAVDVDGVLRDTSSSLVRIYRKHHRGHRVTPIQKWKDWPVEGYFPIGKDIYRFWFRTHPKQVFGGARPYPGAVAFMRRLRRSNGISIWIVTSQPKGTEAITLDWLRRHRIPYDHIAFTDTKEVLKADVLFDDGPHNLDAVSKSAFTVGVCMDRPWNQEVRGLRVYNYDEFFGLLQTLI